MEFLKRHAPLLNLVKKKCCFNKSWIVDRELVTKSDGAVSLVICKGQILGFMHFYGLSGLSMEKAQYQHEASKPSRPNGK